MPGRNLSGGESHFSFFLSRIFLGQNLIFATDLHWATSKAELCKLAFWEKKITWKIQFRVWKLRIFKNIFEISLPGDDWQRNLLLRWDLSTTRVTLTTFLTSRSHLVSWDLRSLVNRKKDFFSVKHHRHNQQNPHHNRHYQGHHVLGVDGPVNQEEAKESKSKDWMFINYTFKRFPLMLFMQMFMVM